MCRDNIDHRHLLDSTGAQFSDTTDRGCPHYPLPLGVNLHDLLLALNQPCIYPHPRNLTIGGDMARVVENTDIVDGQEPEDFVHIVDEDEDGRDPDLNPKDEVIFMLKADAALDGMLVQLMLMSAGEQDPWTHVPSAGLLERLPLAIDDSNANAGVHDGDQDRSEDETDCVSHVAVLGEEDEEHNAAAQEEEVEHNVGLE